jgi:MinD-like ATPase involved in chromosome partitioning or flagellar assembly
MHDTPVPGLRVVGAGSDDAKASVSVSGMRRAIREISKQDAAFVVVSMPPLTTNPDASHLMAGLDMVIPVFHANRTTIDQAMDLVRAIADGAKPVAVVLNRYCSPYPRWWPDADRR